MLSIPKRLVSSGGWRFFAAIAVFLALSIAFWLLPPNPLFTEPLSAVLLARDGSLLGARIAADEQWRFPGLSQAPEKFSRALIAYEDKRFNSHPGVDPLALLRALRSNWREGRVVSGASTLTMQLARLVEAQHAARGARGYAGKLYETLLALRLELSYSKDEILAEYANHAPFGGNVVGLEAAAWRYVGRSPAELSWAEAATLAVLPNAPALVTPGRNRLVLKNKRDRLLHRLRERGELNDLDLRLALAEPLVAEPRVLPELVPHLLETLRARNPRRHRFETTLDAGLQAFAAQAVREHSATLLRQGIGNAAALIVDNQTFEVLAYVGNSAWSTRSPRSLAVDIVQRPRSTGSILKPFLYAAMLDSGQLLPKMLVPDIPTQFKGYAPENFDRSFRGAVPADEALAQSLNVPAVRLLKEYGVERFYDLLQGLGMSTLTESPGHYGLTLALGGAEGTLWDITRMHANLAHLARQDGSGPAGAYRDLRVFDKTPALASPHRADISAAAAWLTLKALLEVARPAEEAHWREFANSRHIAWKTGTSWGLRDAWAVGSSNRYTVAVWAGNASGEGVPGLTGSLAAAPLLFELHNRLDAADWFPEPVRGMKRIAVCRDDGYLANAECEQVEQWIPAGSHFDRLSPHYQRVHLDARGQRVNSYCERVSRMRHAAWFVLPPTQEYFYRRHHSSYRQLPAYRADCRPEREMQGGTMDFIYPNASGKLYVPIDLNGRQGRAVFEAVHREQGATLYWHLDARYVGRTETFHQVALDLTPGRHSIAIVDETGNRLTRTFEALARE